MSTNTMSIQETIPLLNHPLGLESAFTPEALVCAVRAERSLPVIPIPEVCVLDFDGDLTDWLVRTGAASPCPSWACFHTSMFSVEVDGGSCGVIARTIGGPYAVLIAEQLAVSGARVVIGLTSAGRVSPSLPIPSLVVATQAPSRIADILAAELGSLGIPVFQGAVWTTDAPYRETHEQFVRHAGSGSLAVEMQAASLFAFAAARHVAVGVVAHITNAVDHAGEPFDKGPQSEGYALLKAVYRAGARWVAK